MTSSLRHVRPPSVFAIAADDGDIGFNTAHVDDAVMLVIELMEKLAAKFGEERVRMIFIIDG